MKNISAFLSVILCLNIMLSVCADNVMTENASATFAEKTVVSAQNDAEINTGVLLSETEVIRRDILDSIGIMENTSYFDINLNSNENYFTSTYRMNNSTVSDVQRAELTTFINGLFELVHSLRSDGKTDTEGNSAYLAESKIVLRTKDEDGKWDLHTVWVYVKNNLVSFKVLKDGATTTFDISISNSNKIALFLANASFKSFNIEKNDTNTPKIILEIDIGENSYSYDGVYINTKYIYSLTDTIDFTFTVPAECKNKIFDEVAVADEEVQGTFKKYKRTDVRNKFSYHLVLSGSRGKVELETGYNASFDGSEEQYSYNFPITFINARRVENSAIVEYTKGKAGGTNLKLTFENKEIKEVLLDDIVCQNLVYKNYSGDESLADQYVEKTEEDKEALIKDREENSVDIPAQDPERYVTELKGPRANDGKVYDYTISFIAEIPADFTGRATPSWYKDLGDNVKVTLLGLDQTLEGVPFQNRTMVRFEGSKDVIWFNISSSEWSRSETSASVKNSYNSLLSFDGKQYIRNTIEYNTMNLDVYFEGEDYELKTISIKVGGSSVNVNADNIKYIGGGKMVYENIF